MLSDATVTVLVKLLAVGLLGVTGVGTVVLLSEGDLSAAVPGLLGLYVGVVLAIGVFTGSFALASCSADEHNETAKRRGP
jgi:hypothetical protein